MKFPGVMEQMDTIIESSSITAFNLPVCSVHSEYELFIMAYN